ncbi:MAG: hypothetical protein Q8J64_01375 [Thermodesulfovibrionales bacterium]|nr:hypothetical protein [Thermodesulfovibrionales bacterium]
MAKEPNGIIMWDVTDIANALKISAADVREYFTDGRRISFILERRIAHEILKGTIASSEGSDFDVVDSEGGKWEVRSISKGGIYFCPSYMVGSGRKFDKGGFKRKTSIIKGYIIADIEKFPDVPFWIIPTEQVLSWWDAGKLGTTTKISHKKALSLISRLGEK